MTFTEERLPSGQIGGVLQVWLSFWKFLPSPYSSRPVSPDCSVWSGGSRKSLHCSKLPFRNYVGHCALGNLPCNRTCFVAFLRGVSQHNPVSDLCRKFLPPYGWVIPLICISSCETLYRQLCAFPNHVQSILPQVDYHKISIL